MPIDTGLFWGVDSYVPANHTIGKGTLFDLVVKDAGGTIPDFWGRYVLVAKAPTASNPYPQVPLSRTEANYIFSAGNGQCRILIVYNGLNNSKPPPAAKGKPPTRFPGSVQGTFDDGKADAQDAINVARNCGVPEDRNIMIYGDIEDDWKVSKDWVLGWWDVMFRSNFRGAGGIYTNTNLPSFTRPYQDALAASALTATRLLWTTQPFKGCVMPSKIISTFPGPTFSPAGAATFPRQVAVWQYGRNCHLAPNSQIGYYDVDLANQDGFDSMWPSSVPVPP
jgi:hypothetical protein